MHNLGSLSAGYYYNMAGQTYTKIHKQYTKYFAKPIQLNDSIFMIGLNLPATKNTSHAALYTLDSNGNLAEFKNLYRIGQVDTNWLYLTHVHQDKQGNYYAFGLIGYNDQYAALGYMLKVDSYGNKVALKYYRGTGKDFHFEAIVYDTITNSFIITGSAEQETPNKLYSFVMRIDSNGNYTHYNTFRQEYEFIQIKHEWNALILSGSHWEPLDSQIEETAPVIRYLRLDDLTSKWKHPLYYGETDGYFGYNSYSTPNGYIYFNADIKKNTNGFNSNNHIIKLDTNGQILSYTATCSKDSLKSLEAGYQLDDSVNIEIGAYRKPPYSNWDWKFLIRKSSLSGKVYNEWIWDSNVSGTYYPNILHTYNNTSLVAIRLGESLSYTPLVLMKFDSDLKRIPFDEGAKPMEYMPNIKKGDTLYVDGGTDTVYLYNKTSIWERYEGRENIKNVYHIFPNPTNDLLYINGLPPQKTNITLYDVLGKKVFSTFTSGEKLYNINVGHLPKGLYIILVGHISQKIVVE